MTPQCHNVTMLYGWADGSEKSVQFLCRHIHHNLDWVKMVFHLRWPCQNMYKMLAAHYPGSMFTLVWVTCVSLTVKKLAKWTIMWSIFHQTKYMGVKCFGGGPMLGARTIKLQKMTFLIAFLHRTCTVVIKGDGRWNGVITECGSDHC